MVPLFPVCPKHTLVSFHGESKACYKGESTMAWDIRIPSETLDICGLLPVEDCHNWIFLASVAEAVISSDLASYAASALVSVGTGGPPGMPGPLCRGRNWQATSEHPLSWRPHWAALADCDMRAKKVNKSGTIPSSHFPGLLVLRVWISL